MTSQTSSALTLNVVPLSFSSRKLQAGRIAYHNDEDYKRLREEHWQTHAFRYDSRTQDIVNVSLIAGQSPLGDLVELDLQENMLLVARAIQHQILLWIAPSLKILRANKQLVFLGKANTALLLTQALQKAGIPPFEGLEVPLRYAIDCRMFGDAEDQMFLGLVIDVTTANVLDIPVSDLVQRGLSIVGKYVCRRRDTDLMYLGRRLDYLGRVTALEGNRLLLADSEAETEVTASHALLEPRTEYLQEVLQALYGARAPVILSTLRQLRQPVATATGKLNNIRATLNTLKKRGISIGNGVVIEFGELLERGTALFPVEIATERPTMLFGAQGRNTGPYPDRGIKYWGPYMYMQHTRNEPLMAVLCEANNRGRVEQFVQALREGLPDANWSGKGENPFSGGLIGKFRLSKVRVEYEECRNSTPVEYSRAAKRLMERLTMTPDIAVVQIRKDFRKLRGNENPYLTAKAAFMSAGVPVQAVCIENMDHGSNMAYVLNNVALASYAKLDGKPWVISTRGPTTHELVIGIGSTEIAQGRSGRRKRYVGITTVFQGDGRYMLWGLTREVAFEDYVEALFENLRTVMQYVQEKSGWQGGDRVRLICHVYKRLKDCEVDAIKALVRQLADSKFAVEFAFLDISSSHPYQVIDPTQKGVDYWSSGNKRVKGQGVPIRGLCLQLDRRRGLLQLTGPTDVKTDEQGLPRPLLVELHPDSDFRDLTYLLRQVYHFSFMSWQNFFPATEPVTIKYSQMIARLLGNLAALPEWDSTVVSVGALRGRHWFL